MQFTLAITGASGAILGREMLRLLEADDRVERVHFVASEPSLRVLMEELGVSGRNDLIEKLLGAAPKKGAGASKIVQHCDADIGAAIASGSYPSDGMIVLPCSMGTLAKIANGMADTLIARAADVALKERRRLVVVPRETPLTQIHLRRLLELAEAGATIFPVIPAFYHHPVNTEEMARQFACRVLAFMGLAQPGAQVWKEDRKQGTGNRDEHSSGAEENA